jgi:hypothetical protein
MYRCTQRFVLLITNGEELHTTNTGYVLSEKNALLPPDFREASPPPVTMRIMVVAYRM